jgi:peptidoglycan/xylan/chitin deacetylase (PgdA/CDA1 family)
MNHRISDSEIQYLMDHLDALYSGTSIRQYLSLNKQENLFVPLSEKPFDPERVMRIDEIPVLFPCSDKEKWYSENGKRVLFHHDILKSAFYLLSGYQEHHFSEPDHYGRFPWNSSIQYSLGITQKPVVNYYFELILDAFERFCQLNGLEFKRKTREAPTLFLSHDVDRIRKYTLRNLVISVFQVLGIKSGSLASGDQLKMIRDYAKGILLFRKDPYWNFQEMLTLENELNISSTWFFLEKTKLDNSRYHFSDIQIRDLIANLSDSGHEIGIHGSHESSEDQHAMNAGIQRLNAVCKSPVTGIRQHFLKFSNPATSGIQVNAGLEYDATLGFAEQIGFRNSYAYPFRLYDFENCKAMDIWQLPLNVMEATFMEYLKVPTASIPETIQPLLDEVIRFNGVFSLLWHNCRLDEEWSPGINELYRRLLNEIMKSGFISRTGQQTIDLFKSGDVSGKN